MRLGIMQGRLVPPEEGHFQCFPRDRWREEFVLAEEAGLDSIEWIYDLRGADVNPLVTDSGVAEMKALAARHGVAVVSLCADYFMDRPFATASADEFGSLTTHLQWVLGRCRLAGITRVVLPFVDASKIETAEQLRRI